MSTKIILLIKSNPFVSENALGVLYLALSTAQTGGKAFVIFIESGVECIIKGLNSGDLLPLASIEDVILSLHGLVSFYYVPPANGFDDQLRTLIPGIKKIDYSILVDLIAEHGENIATY